MPTAEEFMENLNDALNRTADEMEPTMVEAALNAKALLSRRVHAEGFGRRYTSRAYVALRIKRGMQVRFVDLTFTGKMFQNWRLPGSYREDLKVGGYVGGTDDETKNKLKWNKSRYPEFDKLNDEEKSIIAENLIKPRLLTILNKNLYQK